LGLKQDDLKFKATQWVQGQPEKQTNKKNKKEREIDGSFAVRKLNQNWAFLLSVPDLLAESDITELHGIPHINIYADIYNKNQFIGTVIILYNRIK
jgi:hypothetical protein